MMMLELKAKTILTLTLETYAVRFLALGASFVSNILLARLLGPEGKGYLATAFLWSSLLAGILTLGLDSTAIYYVGKSHSNFFLLAKGFLVYAIVASLLGTGILQLVGLYGGVFDGHPILLWVTSGFVLSTLLTLLFNVLYIGLGRLSFVNKVSAASSFFCTLFLIAMFIIGIRDIQSVLWGVLASQLISTSWLVFAILWVRPFEKAESIHWLEFSQYAFKVYIGNLAGLFYLKSNFLILTLMASVKEVGIYSIAQIFSDIILILPTALINIFFPRVAGMNREQAIKSVSQITRFSAAISLLMTLGISIAATFLVPIAFGSAFQPAIGMVWILCIGSWLGAVGMVTSIYFNGVGKPEIPSSAGWIGFVLVTLLTIIFVPQWGGYGAAMAVCLSRMAVTGYMLVRYLQDSREKPFTVLFLQLADLEYGLGLLRSMRSRIS